MRFRLARTKRPSEQFPIGIDFTNALKNGDVLANAVITADDAAGGDATATFLTNPVLTPTQAIITLRGGVPQRYVVNFAVDTAAGNHFEHDVTVLVSATG